MLNKNKLLMYTKQAAADVLMGIQPHWFWLFSLEFDYA